MKYKLSNILFLGLFLQVISTQGIITFNFFRFLGDWELKSFLHPLGILIVFIYYLLRFLNGGKFRYSGIDFFLFFYFLICIFLLIFNVSDSSGFLFAFREIILIFLLIFLYQQTNISLHLWRKILGFLHILVLANLLFVILTYVYGPEEYMKLVTGRFIWPIDSEYKFKISNFYIFWRSPALIGETAAVGHFGLLCYFLFAEDEKYKKKRLLPLVLVLLTFVRSVYLVLVVFFVFRFFLKKRNLFKLEVILPYLVPSFFLLAIPFYNFKLLSLKSIMARFDHWINDLDVKFNLLIGGAIGEVGGAVRGDGFVSTLDSYWLLMLVSTGILGIVMIILFMKEKVIDQRMKIILISFLCAAFFVTITQSIPFLVLFPLLFIQKGNEE